MLKKLISRLMPGPGHFEAELADLLRIIDDPESMFSGAAMVQSLMELEPLALRCGPHAPQLAQLYDAMSRVEYKRGHGAETLLHARRALAIHQTHPCFAAEQAFFLHYRLFHAALQEEQPQQALLALDVCMQQLDAPWLDAGSRLGLRQEYGHALHEAGRISEALLVNEQCLRAAEVHLGVQDSALCGVLNNLAQNHFELGQLQRAEDCLRRRLQLARADEEYEIEADSLFQIGVLMVEQGRLHEAAALFDERLQRARELDDDGLIEAASEALLEFRRLAVG